MSEKTRDLTLADLFHNLQKEYLSYFMRSKIYCKNFAENYMNAANMKKDKIEKISSYNNLHSIFNNAAVREKFINEFLGHSSIPDFTYKDEYIKAKMGRWDNYYYFRKGTSVSFLVDGTTNVGTVDYNNTRDNLVRVHDSYGNSYTLHYYNVTRIFPNNFFDF